MSNLTRKALLVGINYIGTSSELSGCINDVLAVRDQYLKNNVKPENIVLLTDFTPVKPSKQNIISELKKLVSSQNCILYFHYSGHGSNIKDKNSEEADGRDEVIVPLDFNQSGFLVDDDLKKILLSLPTNSSFYGVFDSCFSGTVLDLRYMLKPLNNNNYRFDINWKVALTAGRVVCLSGCMDKQVSEEVNGQGLLTKSFLQVMQKYGYKPKLGNLLREVNDFMIKSGFAQRPQLSCGKVENVDSTFGII